MNIFDISIGWHKWMRFYEKEGRILTTRRLTALHVLRYCNKIQHRLMSQGVVKWLQVVSLTTEVWRGQILGVKHMLHHLNRLHRNMLARSYQKWAYIITYEEATQRQYEQQQEARSHRSYDWRGRANALVAY